MHAHRSTVPMLAAVLLLGAALLSASPASARPWNQRFEAGDSADVQVRTDDANVRIRTRDSGPVEIEVKHDAKTWGWVHGRREPQVSIRREGRTVVVEAMTPDEMVVLGGYVLDFSITLTMPRHGRLSVRTEDGRIECDSFTGDVRLEASDGAILGTGLAGPSIAQRCTPSTTAIRVAAPIRSTIPTPRMPRPYCARYTPRPG